MTILNVWITPESVLLGCDSEVADGKGGKRGHITKFFAMPHIDAVVAHRGDGLFFTGVLSACYASLHGFDDLSDALGQVLPQSLPIIQAMAAQRHAAVR